MFCGFLLLSYYTVIAGWSLFYFAKSTGWMVGGFPEGASMGDLFGEQSANGGLQLGLSLGFSIATVSIVYFGVQKGIERIARVFLPILFGILVLLLVSALRMTGPARRSGSSSGRASVSWMAGASSRRSATRSSRSRSAWAQW